MSPNDEEEPVSETPSSLADQSVNYRSFMALLDLTPHIDAGDVTTELVMQAISQWTTDEIDPENTFISQDYKDALELGNYVMTHLQAHQAAHQQIEWAEQVSEKMKQAGVDPEKLAAQDPEEWAKLRETMNEPDTSDAFPEDFTIDDILAAEPQEEHYEPTPEERQKELKLMKVNGQAQMNHILHVYLNSVVTEDWQMAHQVIDNVGCPLTHVLTQMLFRLIENHGELPQGLSLEDWIQSFADISERVSQMSEEEKLDFADRLEADGDDSYDF